MTTLMSHAARFVPRSGETWRDPWPMYAGLRDHDPVHRVVPPDKPDEDYYVLSRYADVFAAARDPQTFSSATGITTDYHDLEKIGMTENRPFVFTDPPDHTTFRRMVSKGFTPRHVTAIEPEVREFVVERIERLCAAGEGDIVAELFKPLPSMVVAHYLGVPEEDRDRFDEWSDHCQFQKRAARFRECTALMRFNVLCQSPSSGHSIPGSYTAMVLCADLFLPSGPT